MSEKDLDKNLNAEKILDHLENTEQTIKENATEIKDNLVSKKEEVLSDINESIDQMKAEFKEAKEEVKSNIKETITETKEELQTIKTNSQHVVDEIPANLEEKTDVLKSDLHKAEMKVSNKIEKTILEIFEKYNSNGLFEKIYSVIVVLATIMFGKMLLDLFVLANLNFSNFTEAGNLLGDTGLTTFLVFLILFGSISFYVVKKHNGEKFATFSQKLIFVVSGLYFISRILLNGIIKLLGAIFTTNINDIFSNLGNLAGVQEPSRLHIYLGSFTLILTLIVSAFVSIMLITSNFTSSSLEPKFEAKFHELKSKLLSKFKK